MLRWQSSVSEVDFRNPSNLHSDSFNVPVNPELFTNAALEFPSLSWHQKADTLWASLYCMLLAGYAVIVTLSWIVKPFGISQAALFSVCNLILLLITGLLQRHLDAQLKKAQRQGYLKFSALLEWIVNQPFQIVAYGTSIVLLVVTWDGLQQRLGIPHLLLLRIVILLQLSWTGALVCAFILKVYGHNKSHCHPDAIDTLCSALRPSSGLEDIRYIDGGGLAEQQAALLHYQQDNLQYLSQEILRLQEILSKYEKSQDGSTPQVDLVHLLAAREQELRAITAERDQLQAEVRLARGLIAERDADILQVRSINDQYVEENDRVRAMLNEWSSRTAKLELALEAERRSNQELQKKINQLRSSSAESS
ncbi:hypothetical protein M758_11G146400 [Ceratodon purpureus]|uniref:Transmembrane protein n=1 Tax=Ceratodon purpureus TaxID=3225 RepID=A0A8T0GGF2_CERPU|nr:hypothetical protein KC19_11G150900 [Ceratodon purpureus]KAG0601897.1 hypothetical protein M758_11G146400 [Ceratodon purpureus]